MRVSQKGKHSNGKVGQEMAKYLANEHGEWIALEGDRAKLYVFDTEEPEAKALIEAGDISLEGEKFGNVIVEYGEDIHLRIFPHAIAAEYGRYAHLNKYLSIV